MRRVAFQGEPGSFSHAVALQVLGAGIDSVPCREFRDVGVAIEQGRADYAVLPVENSIAGSVLPAYDVLLNTTANVVGEVTHLIRHCVMGVSGARMQDLRRVYSHPVALAQCSRFFEQHRQLEAIAVYDTAGAAQEVARANDRTLAAIAAETAAQLYGLDVLLADVQDRADNQTRFYILTREHTVQFEAGRMKTALLLETKNQPGALVSVLRPLADAGVNLSKLESRPGETPWTYRFFLELDGAITDTAMQRALEHVRAAAAHVHVLGSFPVLATAQPQRSSAVGP